VFDTANNMIYVCGVPPINDGNQTTDPTFHYAAVWDDLSTEVAPMNKDTSAFIPTPHRISSTEVAAPLTDGTASFAIRWGGWCTNICRNGAYSPSTFIIAAGFYYLPWMVTNG
jgi:hypothetical protein